MKIFFVVQILVRKRLAFAMWRQRPVLSEMRHQSRQKSMFFDFTLNDWCYFKIKCKTILVLPSPIRCMNLKRNFLVYVLLSSCLTSAVGIIKRHSHCQMHLQFNIEIFMCTQPIRQKKMHFMSLIWFMYESY